MANIILTYLFIGLVLSGLYVWKTDDSEILRRLSKSKYIATLLFVVALITIFWLPIGVFALIGTAKRIKSDE